LHSYHCPQCGYEISYLDDPCPYCSVCLSWINGTPHKDNYRGVDVKN